MVRSLFVALALVACSPAVPEANAPSAEARASQFWPTCSQACERARTCKLDIAKPSQKGAACEDVCTNAQDNGVSFGTRCIVQARDCGAAARCL